MTGFSSNEDIKTKARRLRAASIPTRHRTVILSNDENLGFTSKSRRFNYESEMVRLSLTTVFDLLHSFLSKFGFPLVQRWFCLSSVWRSRAWRIRAAQFFRRTISFVLNERDGRISIEGTCKSHFEADLTPEEPEQPIDLQVLRASRESARSAGPPLPSPQSYHVGTSLAKRLDFNCAPLSRNFLPPVADEVNERWVSPAPNQYDVRALFIGFHCTLRVTTE